MFILNNLYSYRIFVYLYYFFSKPKKFVYFTLDSLYVEWQDEKGSDLLAISGLVYFWLDCVKGEGERPLLTGLWYSDCHQDLGVFLLLFLLSEGILLLVSNIFVILV